MTFWSGKQVLLTGHTGFKGAWAARILAGQGAVVTGLGLPPEDGPSLFGLLGHGGLHRSHLVDLRDMPSVVRVVQESQPQVVLHLAAQALVRQSYADPVRTFGSNVMGTVHLLEALRLFAQPEAVLVVTSDKVYANDGSGRAYGEGDALGGHDPYSASKAATEIVVAAYRQSYFAPALRPLATARGGNVIGGGDFSADRLVPDIVRALAQGTQPVLRNPAATRPWQHVLDCIDGYLAYARALLGGGALPFALNFGPAAGAGTLRVGDLANGLMRAMGRVPGFALDADTGPHEMQTLGIDAGLAAQSLNWQPALSGPATLDWTAAWYAAWLAGEDLSAVTDRQIARYQEMRA